MIFTTFKRITRTGFVNFWRNGFLSFAAIVVITLSLCSFGAIIFTGAFGRALINDIQSKVDIKIYFSLSAPETDILALQKDIQALPEVASTTYISKAQALAAFKAKWQDNTLIMQGLDEAGNDILPAALTILAKDPGQYGSITTFLHDKNPLDSTGAPIISKVNYLDNKLIIDRLSRVIPATEKLGLIIAIILVAVAAIVVWNTIRLVTFTVKDEISVMKLVGASNVYIRGPLVVSGVMYGIVSGLITLSIMAAFANWSDAVVLRFAGVQIASDFSLMVDVLSKYFAQNFIQIFVLIMGAGIILGGVSSYISARKYLKV